MFPSKGHRGAVLLALIALGIVALVISGQTRGPGVLPLERAASAQGIEARANDDRPTIDGSQKTTAETSAPGGLAIDEARPLAAPEEPADIPATREADPVAEESAPAVNYIILPGDTLGALALRHEITVDELLQLNSGLDPARITAGQLIKVPDKAILRYGSRPRLVWPAYGPITTPFGEPGSSWIGGYHMGLDIGADTGDLVWAADAGVIVSTGEDGLGRGYGTYVLVYHYGKWWTLYAHLSEVFRGVGYQVRKGEPIGEVGMTGFADGPHLHFEVWYDEQVTDAKRLDPISFLP